MTHSPWLKLGNSNRSFQILQARFEGSQFCYKSSGANQGCQFLQKFCEKLIGLQERQKEVLEGVTSVMKITDYKTQVIL